MLIIHVEIENARQAFRTLAEKDVPYAGHRLLCRGGGVRQLAPQLRLSVLPLARRDAIEALGDGRADMALGFLWDAPETLSNRRLYEESFLVAGLSTALPEAPVMTLDAYC